MPQVDALTGQSTFPGSPGVASVNNSAGNVQTSSQPLTYADWINLPENAHYAYSPGGSTKAYQNYLLGLAGSQADPCNYNGFDVTGYSQSGWDLEKTKELLEEQRAYNSAEAEKNRQWQERMSNSAYQRAVEDLEKAGLNKWLAVTGGNGANASTPSGSTASSSSGDVSTPNPVLYKAILQAFASIASSALKLFG